MSSLVLSVSRLACVRVVEASWVLSGGLTVVLLCLPLVCLPLFSQTTTGRILGSVSDQTGAALSGATVVITDVQRGVTRTVTTDEAGAYVAPNLFPGVYKIRIEARGFKTVERLGVELEVAQDIRIDLTLQLGEVSQTVVITSEVPLLNTTSATLGGTLSNKEINDLPME